MANIQSNLNKIKNAVLGIEVRDSIHDAIKQCYDDASAKDNANMEVKMARGEYENLGKRLDSHSSQIKEKANKNEVFTMANMGQDVKEAMTGGSVAVVGKNMILNENIVDEQISPIKTNFLTQGKNKFDGVYVDGVITTEYLDISTMKIRSNLEGEKGMVAIIPIKPNETYTFRVHDSSNRRRWGIMNSYPDISSTPLSIDTPLYHNDSHTGGYTFTNTSEGKYFVAFVSNNGFEPRAQLEIGEEATEYEEYKVSFKNRMDLSIKSSELPSINGQIVNDISGINFRPSDGEIDIRDNVYIIDNKNNKIEIPPQVVTGLNGFQSYTYILFYRPSTKQIKWSRIDIYNITDEDIIFGSIKLLNENGFTEVTGIYNYTIDDVYIETNIETNKTNIETNKTNIEKILNVFNYNIFDGNYDENIGVLTYPDSSSCDYNTLSGAISCIVKVKPNTTYTIRKFESSNRFRVASYHKKPTLGVKDLTLLFSEDTGNTKTFTTLGNTEYIVIYVSNNNIKPKITIIQGDTCDTFIEYDELQIKNELINNQIDNNEKYYLFEGEPYSATNNIEGGSTSDTINLENSSYTVILDIYDDLVANYSEYVSKTLLGYDESGLEMYKYSFVPISIMNKTSYQIQKTKIAILSSIHGYEQGAAWCTAQFFKDLCQRHSDNDILNFIYRNVQFEVLPVGNPYGFSNNQRKNYNNVDLNRNFDINWFQSGTVDDDYYSGENAASEKETQIIAQFIESNLDAIHYIDYHNISGGNPLFYLDDDESMTLCNSLFLKLSDKWQKEYPEIIPKGTVIGYANTGLTRCSTLYAKSKGLKSICIETPWTMPYVGRTKYDQATIKTGVEVLGNTIYLLIKNL